MEGEKKKEKHEKLWRNSTFFRTEPVAKLKSRAIKMFFVLPSAELEDASSPCVI